MYLVQMLKFTKEDSCYYLSPKIEKLQAFEYQLRSDDWSVIDCIPEKGAAFEVHFGSAGSDVHSADGLEYVVSAVCMAANSLLAIKAVGLMELWLEDSEITDDLITGHVFEQDGILLMYVEGVIDSSAIFTKIL